MKEVRIDADYATARRAAYPDIGDQLDAMFKIIEAIRRSEPLPADALEVLDKVRAVKAVYPKQEAAK